jgi:tetratricopeptide (TPR) repeat protein
MYQAGQGRTQLGLGNVYQVTRKLEKSQEMYNKARATRAKLAGAHPETAEYQRDLAVTHSNLAMVMMASGHGDKEAEASLREAIALQQKLVRDFPNISQYKNDLARSQFNVADLQARAEQFALAATAYQEAVNLWKELTAIHPAVQDFRINLAEAYSSLASTLASLKQFEPAEVAAQGAIKIKEELARKHPDIPTYQNDLARGHLALGDVQRAAGQANRAGSAYQEALRILDKLTQDRPGVPQYQGDRARAWNNLGLAYADDKQTDEAEKAFQQARALWETLQREQPQVAEWALGLSRTCSNLGNFARFAGKMQIAVDRYTAAIEPLEKLRAEKRLSPPAQQALRHAYWKRAETRTQLGQYEQALRDWALTMELTVAADQSWFRLQRALALARSGDHVRAVAEADPLRKDNSSSADNLYQLACIYAVSAAAVKNAMPAPADAQQLADEYGGRAMELLERLKDLGFFQNRTNVERLNQDGDWQAVRGRDRFQKLLP